MPPRKGGSLLSHYSLNGHGPHPQQIKFHIDPAIYRLYGGAKGGGKSVALLWEAIGWCLRIPGCNVLLLRRTFPELMKGLVRHFELLVPSKVYGSPRNYNKSDHTVVFPNGSKLYFGCAQHEKDIMSYQGHEYVFIGIDEATEWTYWMFEFLSIQNRCPIKTYKAGDGTLKPVVPCMALATNPGGIGHEWIKALFIGELQQNGKYKRTLEHVRKRIPELQGKDIDLAQYSFISAKIYDNPTFADDKVYLKKLENMNQADKERYLLGSWEVFEGAYFTRYDEVLTKQEKFLIRRLVRHQKWHPKWISIDWGYAHHFAVYWFSKVTVTDQEGSTREATIAYREYVDNFVGEAELARNIAEKCVYRDDNGVEQVEGISDIYLSPDAFAKRGSQNTVAEQLGEVFAAYRLPMPTAADDDRIGGARLMDEMLSRRPDPEFLISEECEELLQAIPILQRNPDPARNEDVLKTDRKSDDVYDACRYGLKSALASGKTPFEIERQRALAGCGSNQEKFWTDVMLKSKHTAASGIRIGKHRSFKGLKPW